MISQHDEARLRGIRKADILKELEKRGVTIGTKNDSIGHLWSLLAIRKTQQEGSLR